MAKVTTAHIETAVPRITKAAQITHAAASGVPRGTAAAESEGQAIAGSVRNGLGHAAGDLAKALGLHDFYSAHLLNFCEGYFVPGAIPNASVPQSSISKNVTACSNMTTKQIFDPQSILQQQLSNSGVSIADIQWPEQITAGLDTLRAAQRAMVVLYYVTIGFMFLALVSTVANIFCCSCGLGYFVMALGEWVAVCALGLAAALVTGVAVKSADLINTYGNGIGVSANIGLKFLALTWIAWVVILVAAFL